MPSTKTRSLLSNGNQWWARLLLLLPLFMLLVQNCNGDPEAKRLYEDLLTDYNRLIRPVGNNSDRLTVKLGLKLSQLIDVNLKNQIMTTNVWVEQEWVDYKLKWDPEEYGGVKTLHVPSENIWLPDIVLYNNADGSYEVTLMTKAILRYDGTVTWKPPAIYKSFCEINVMYFPFDHQLCFMKFGSWTYDGFAVDLQHLHQTPNSNYVEVGMDLREYYLSVEWDIMKVPAQRHEKYYSCCDTPYPDIFFNITLRRKTLFYTVNLIIPCVGISCLSVLVFYLPAESGEKMSLCVSILLSLTVFFLLLAEIIPSTSLTVPLLGKYLLFTMILVTLSVVVTIIVLNINFRSPSTHKMAPWVRRVFVEFLPKVLCITRPKRQASPESELSLPTRETEISIVPVNITDDWAPPHAEVMQFSQYKTYSGASSNNGRFSVATANERFMSQITPDSTYCQRCSNVQVSPKKQSNLQPELEHAMDDARFIAQHMRNRDRFDSIVEDWKFVAMVLDRLFLWVFTIACIAGMAGIILQAPALYDTTQPIDIKYSKIAQAKLKHLANEFTFT